MSAILVRSRIATLALLLYNSFLLATNFNKDEVLEKTYLIITLIVWFTTIGLTLCILCGLYKGFIRALDACLGGILCLAHFSGWICYLVALGRAGLGPIGEGSLGERLLAACCGCIITVFHATHIIMLFRSED